MEHYLQSYPHTVLVVSHDRSFLNEVCQDIIVFRNLKLTYYRGNFDTYLATHQEEMVVQQRRHEAQAVKLNHMQVRQAG